MSDTLPPRTPRRLPLGWAGIAVVTVAAGGLWVWLGRLVPEGSPALLASVHSGLPAGGSAGSNGTPRPVAAASPLVVQATPPMAVKAVPPPVPVMVAASPPTLAPRPASAAAPVATATPPPTASVAPAQVAPPVPPPAIPPPAVKPPVTPPDAEVVARATPQTPSQTLPPPATAAAPPATVAQAPAEQSSAATRPSFDIVRVTPRGEAVLAGRAAPGAKVTITDNGREIAQATGDSEGQWVALPGASLPEGGQLLALSSATPAGPAVTGDAPLLVIVPPASTPSVAAPMPALAMPALATPSLPAGAAPPVAAATAVAILTPPNAAPRVLQGLPPAPSAHAGASRLGLDVVDYDEHGAIRFGGTAPPGATLRAYVDNHAAGDALADIDGHWSLAPPDSVTAGDHRLRVDQLSGSGHVAARVELPFERSAMAVEDLREGRVVVQPRATLWRIARKAYGQGVRYTIIYQANRDQIRDPNRIFPGQLFAIPAPPGHAATVASP